MLVLKRSIGGGVALKAALNIALTGLALGTAGCSVTVTDDTGTTDSSEYNTSDNSNAMAMPPGTNAAARITLPMELIATGRHAEGSLKGQSAKRSPAINVDEAKTTKISLECVGDAQRDPRRIFKHEADSDMAGVHVSLGLIGVNETGEAKENDFIASLSQEVECVEFVVSLQNLPVGKTMQLGALIGNQLGVFSGRTKQFTFDGAKMVYLALKMKPDESGTGAIVDVSFEAPSAPLSAHSIRIVKELLRGKDAETLNKILLKNAPDSKKRELSRRGNTERYTIVQYGEVSCVMISNRCTLNGVALVTPDSVAVFDALLKASQSLIQDRTRIAVHALGCITTTRQKDPQTIPEETTFCHGIPGIGPELDGRVTIQ